MSTTSKVVKNNKMCCVPGCSNKKGDGIQLHSIPAEPKARKAWVHKCRLGKKINKHDRVCGRHFTASDYRTAKCVYLWTYAVPNQNLPLSSVGMVKEIDFKRGERLKCRNSAKKFSKKDPAPTDNCTPQACAQISVADFGSMDHENAASVAHASHLEDKSTQVNNSIGSSTATSDHKSEIMARAPRINNMIGIDRVQRVFDNEEESNRRPYIIMERKKLHSWDDFEFFSRFRMTKASFVYVLHKIVPHLPEVKSVSS